MSKPPDLTDPTAEEFWRYFFLYGYAPREKRLRPLFGRLPADPRCKMCFAPFNGVGSLVMRYIFHKQRSMVNPSMCNSCETLMFKYMGGAEVELSMLFADVRGSTSLAERMSIEEFRSLIDRFFQASVGVLAQTDAYIDKLIGDEVSAGFIPGLSGPLHALRAIEAAQEILRVTGHADPGGPWIPVGVGVHTGVSYVGTVGTRGGFVDFTALGDAPNTAARLASNAQTGEILVSEQAWSSAGLPKKEDEQRELQVKGRTQPVQVHSLRLAPGSSSLVGF